MSERNGSEIEELRREVRELREMVKKLLEEREERPRRSGRDALEVTLSGIGELIEDILESVRSELEKAIIVKPHGGVFIAKKQSYVDAEGFDYAAAARILSVLANEKRLRILSLLARGGKYFSELQKELPDVPQSTLASHLDALKEAGLVVQEAVRGRYLITIPGRIALRGIEKMIRRMGEFE